MGSFFSSIPNFPAANTAKGVFPPDEVPKGFTAIALVPQKGMLKSSVAVYLLSDDQGSSSTLDYPAHPDYFFKMSGSSAKLLKIIKDTVEDKKDKTELVAKIKQGWQTSKGHQELSVHSQHHADITTSAQKNMSVVCKIGNVEEVITVTKKFERSKGIWCELSDGFELIEKAWVNTPDATKYATQVDLCKNNEVLAIIHEHNIKQPASDREAMMQFLQRPVGVYLKAKLTEQEKVQLIAMVAVAHPTLIRMAQLTIQDGMMPGRS